MSKYSEVIGSFIRMGNFPLEADYIFATEADLKEFYTDEFNKATLHRGLLKIVIDDGTGNQALYWITQDGDNIEFKKLISANTTSSVEEMLDELGTKLDEEIENRKVADQAIYGTTDVLSLPEDLDSIKELADAVISLTNQLIEDEEVLEKHGEDLKAVVGTENDTIVEYLQTLDYKSLTEVSEALHKWLEETDEEEEKINTLPELQAFLAGFTQTNTLSQILADLQNNIYGSPLPSEEFRTLRGIEDFVRIFKAQSENVDTNLQSELDKTQIGIGLSSDGSFSADQETVYLKDATSVMNALKTLDNLIDQAINNCNIETVSTNTVDLVINKYKDKNEITADLKISTEEGNGVVVKSDGIYHKVQQTYDKGILTLYINDNIVAQHVLGLSYVGIDSALYDTTTEELVLVFKKEDGTTDELRVPVHSLIREWTINNSNPSDVVVLTREEVLGGAPDKLSADVRLFNDKYNILVKEGNSLYVKGTADNIVHGDVQVSSILDDLVSKNTELNESLNQEILRAQIAENNLQTAIEAEKVRAEAADSILENNIANISENLNKELTNKANVSDVYTIQETDNKFLTKTDANNTYATKEQVSGDITNQISGVKTEVNNLANEFAKEVATLESKDSELATELSSHANNFNNPHQVTKYQIGLDKVDNTSDLEKPISVAVQEALNQIKLTQATSSDLNAHINDKNNPHQVTKVQIGLDNVDNTSDQLKPVSIAQQLALDKKADIVHTHTMSDITDLEELPIIRGFVNSLDELPESTVEGEQYVIVSQVGSGNARYTLCEYVDGTWKQKLITTGSIACVINEDVYELTSSGLKKILDEDDLNNLTDNILNETKNLIESIEWDTTDSSKIRLKITTKKTFNGSDLTPTISYIDIEKERFMSSAYSRPATQSDVDNGYASKLGVPVLVIELTTGDEVVIDLTDTLNIYDPVDTQSIQLGVSNWTGDASTSYKISANLVVNNDTSDVLISVTDSGVSAQVVWGDYE